MEDRECDAPCQGNEQGYRKVKVRQDVALGRPSCQLVTHPLITLKGKRRRLVTRQKNLYQRVREEGRYKGGKVYDAKKGVNGRRRRGASKIGKISLGHQWVR